MDIAEKIKRQMMRPLVRRRRDAGHSRELITALTYLDEMAKSEFSLPEISRQIKEIRSNKKAMLSDPRAVGLQVTLAKTLFSSRRISEQEFVIFAVLPIEGLHEHRWLSGVYDEDLGPIRDELERLEKEHDLKVYEYWPRGSGPESYEALNAQYEDILDKKLSLTLREFELNELANLLEKDPKNYYQKRERGRRSIFHKNNFEEALKDIVLRYEIEADRAASANAFSAAVTILGAGMEGILLLRCLKSKAKSIRIAEQLPRRKRPSVPAEPTKWTFENLIEICHVAGWLPIISTHTFDHETHPLAHTLRLMRNNVHPARLARTKPWIEIGIEEYKDAKTIYSALYNSVYRKPRKANLG